jgi:hypothetical protein
LADHEEDCRDDLAIKKEGFIMEMQTFAIFFSGLALIFFYAMGQFNKLPPAAPIDGQQKSNLLTTVRQWFQYKELPPPLISPPARANTTAFKYWLYRCAYALIWMLVYTLVMRVPGIREAIPAIIQIVTRSPDLYNLNLTNGLVAAFVIITLTRIPPIKGADATIRMAMYERASIPAQQLGFQYLLRGAPYEPDVGILQKVRKAAAVDDFAILDFELDPEPTTRSLWTKICVLVAHIEIWGKNDRYKTAMALLRDPGSETLSADRVRKDYEALKSDARMCLAELRHRPDAQETRLRNEQFRRDCKAMLEAIYSLLTRVALRSHYGYFDAVTAAREIGFEIEGAVAPLPDKNDIVALCMMLFFVTTVPLAYRLGISHAMSITGIYLMAVLTPIYIAAEFPRLLKKKHGGMPPLAFPLAAGIIAGLLTAGASLMINSICTGNQCPQVLALNQGLDHLLHNSYPWVILVCSLSALLSVLMLIGEYPDHEYLDGYARYRRWGNLRDAGLLSMGILALMAFYVVPQLHQLAPEYFTEALFWRAPGLTLRPVVTSLFIGFFVPTWYRGNALRTRNDRRLYPSPDRTRIQDVPIAS